MLFISPHPQYQLLGIVQEKHNYHDANGAYLGTIPAVNAEFNHTAVPQWAADQALSNPRFRSAWNGLPDGVDYRAYIGSFDTEATQNILGWSDELRETVEQFMLNHPDYGLSFVVADLPLELSGKPWPEYDRCHHMQVHIVAKELGKDLHSVLAYEREHLNRPIVIKKLEESLEGTPEPAEEMVAA